MRLPKLRQLTKVQKDVYLYAPTDKHVLVHGPPGTGKTLIACLRAIELQKRGVPVVLGMFNQVLAQYASKGSDGAELPSQTVQAWFRDWWKASGLPPHASAQKLVIQVPFEEKDRAKAAGARWAKEEFKPWGGRTRGAWVIDANAYFAAPELFADWPIWHSPPSPQEKGQAIDWGAASQHLLENEHLVPDAKMSIGYVLIDEGQDFPPAFYKLLRYLSGIGSSRGVEHPLKCLVLADENQQLTEENSTLSEIAKELKIDDQHRYLLLDNFRNTKEVAEVARRFFADVGVLPNLPKRSGPKPVFTFGASEDDIVARVRTWLVNNPGKEAGVLVFNESDRELFTTRIREVCSKLTGREITVQSYSWQSRAENKARNLLFDVPDVVSVLNMQSCKGLEFDAVFVVNLRRAQIGLYGPDRFKMQMFVAVSRSREWVSLIDSGTGTEAYISQLPDESYLEREALPPRREGAAVSRPTSLLTPANSVVPQPASIKANWELSLLELARAGKLKVDDKRSKGGALWVQDGEGVDALLRPYRFNYHSGRSAWWKK